MSHKTKTNFRIKANFKKSKLFTVITFLGTKCLIIYSAYHYAYHIMSSQWMTLEWTDIVMNLWKETERGLFQYNVPESSSITSMSGPVSYFTNECQAF